MSDFSLRFNLDFDEETSKLNLSLIAAFDMPAISHGSVIDTFKKSGHSHLFVLEENLQVALTAAEDISEKGKKLHEELLAKHKELQSNNESADEQSFGAEESQSVEENIDTCEVLGITAANLLTKLGDIQTSFVLAERRDAQIHIDVEEDDLSAFLTIEAPYGGDPADKDKLQQALSEKGVTHGIDENAFEKALMSSSCKDLLIAKGSKPKKGKASRFEPLVSAQITTGPKIDDKGRANYHDINEFVIVEPGTPLMKRVQPGRGKPGNDVYGGVIPPIPGDELPFSPDLIGAQVSEDSKDILVATMKGHPVIGDRGVSVSNVLMLKNIGLSTGNVDFDGSVCVEEDVADGVNIEVTGDLTVKGVVGKANIKAGGNVVILQGLLGGSKEPQGEDEAPYGACVEAKGSVSAHFMTRAQIRAGKHIVVPEYISHCDLKAEHQILVGQSSGKGNLFGGRAEAFDQVAAKVIGSTGGTPTEIKVGAEGENIVQLRRISKEKRLNDQNTYDVNEALHKISLLAKSAGMTPQMKEKTEKLSKKLDALKDELAELKSREDVIKTLLMKSKKSRVIANQKVFNNTKVSILGSEMAIKEESTGGSFRFDARRVVFEL